MTEGQRRGAPQPRHEGLDARAVERIDVMDMRAVDGFQRRPGGQRVDRLVRVHDQQMQAVRSVAPRRGHGLHVARRQLVVLGLGQAGGERRLPLLKREERVAVGGFQGRQQGGQIARQARDQRLGAGDLQAIGGKRPRTRDRGIELRVGEARRAPLGRQGAGGLARPRRTRARLLQQGEADLQAIVRRERLGQQCRQQQGTFAKLPDDLRFLGHDGLRCFAWLVGQRLPAALDARQRSSTRCVKIA